MNHCPQYQTDNLYRVVDVDRYDDRLMLKTNLIDSYDQMLQFAASHLPDPFYLEKDKRISLRYIITREMVSNILMHREFTSSAASQFVIGREEMYTINPCRAFRDGVLKSDNIAPLAKNPIIAAFFREIGRADQLGSGVTKLFRYCKEYGGSDPVIEESNNFKITVSLKALDEIRFAFGRPWEEKVSVDRKKVSIDSEKVSIESEKWGVAFEKLGIEPQKLGIEVEKLGISLEKLGIDADRLSEYWNATLADLNLPTKEKVLKLVSRYSNEIVFGSPMIASELELPRTSAQWLVKTMADAGLLHSVTGQGKGKYRFKQFTNIGGTRLS